MERPQTRNQSLTLEAQQSALPHTGNLRTWGQQIHREEDGLATAEYGIVMLAAVGFAGLLVAVVSSDTARGLLTGIVERALSF
ncbi:DUF4244 domain-containing protein [Nesterenkonia halotolerans]|uniref:Flp pilus assembly pilin Flp n=1 Tax=Nesterenkonia halotolerans TaxID=225325 RepID=A0ABR9J9K1_9MICC|nr:DUF4244 domain-containing protein [Nesterenkonia halotolerans]MBE1515246.1 Flp pilus assembly pilin Flp [Nesterenkonia halotolerans]